VNKLILENQITIMLALAFLAKETTSFPDEIRDGLKAHIDSSNRVLESWDDPLFKAVREATGTEE